MVGVLTLKSSASPFPYAALTIATYTQQAEVNFDESASGVSLDINGSQITSEEEIVRALAKAGGLADDSAKVGSLVSVATVHVSLTICTIE